MNEFKQYDFLLMEKKTTQKEIQLYSKIGENLWESGLCGLAQRQWVNLGQAYLYLSEIEDELVALREKLAHPPFCGCEECYGFDLDY